MQLLHERRRRWRIHSTLLLLVVIAVVTVLMTLRWRATSQKEEVARALTGGDPARGPALIRRYGCGGCHTVPGVGGADGQVGPPLVRLRQRVFIGGVARNTPDNLVRWIVAPQSLSPQTAMPATGITHSEARDVAAYLYAQ